MNFYFSSLALSDVAIENVHYAKNELETPNFFFNENLTHEKEEISAANENYAKNGTAVSVRSVALEPKFDEEFISNENYHQNWKVLNKIVP